MAAVDLLPFNFTTLLLLSSFIFFLIKSLKKPKSPKNSPKNLPPSPPKLPVIGHLHHLVGDLPHKQLQKLSKKHGPIMHLQLGEVPAVVISSREATKEVLKVQDPACADRPESIASKILWYDYTDIAFSAYNDYWRQMRKICIVELLSTKNVKSFGYIRIDEASRLMNSLQLLLLKWYSWRRSWQRADAQLATSRPRSWRREDAQLATSRPRSWRREDAQLATSSCGAGNEQIRSWKREDTQLSTNSYAAGNNSQHFKFFFYK